VGKREQLTEQISHQENTMLVIAFASSPPVFLATFFDALLADFFTGFARFTADIDLTTVRPRRMSAGSLTSVME
jgi:hypothetical protein